MTSRIRNVHADLAFPGSEDDVHLVKGDYEYWHYCCDGYDDRGWGCGYRTLQTICSWVRLQHHQNGNSPTQTLVHGSTQLSYPPAQINATFGTEAISVVASGDANTNTSNSNGDGQDFISNSTDVKKANSEVSSEMKEDFSKSCAKESAQENVGKNCAKETAQENFSKSCAKENAQENFSKSCAKENAQENFSKSCAKENAHDSLSSQVKHKATENDINRSTSVVDNEPQDKNVESESMNETGEHDSFGISIIASGNENNIQLDSPMPFTTDGKVKVDQQPVCSKTVSDVPSLLEIQRALVRLGDKPDHFVGSRQWIGSYEVCLCLDFFYDVPCKILHIKQGADLRQHLSTLQSHFSTLASPVMMGGDSDASSKGILGVNMHPAALLVVDPHYCGKPRTAASLQKAGWIKWVLLEDFHPTSFYNLCLPQLSDKLIHH